jgi:hypothetical protein
MIPFWKCHPDALKILGRSLRFLHAWWVFFYKKYSLNKLLWTSFFSILSLLIVIFGSVLLRTIATDATLIKKITEIAKNPEHWVAASSNSRQAS